MNVVWGSVDAVLGFVHPFAAHLDYVEDYGFIAKFSIFAGKPCTSFSWFQCLLDLSL